MTSPIYDKTVFKRFFELTDADLLVWRDNVYDKVKGTSILPFYIDKTSQDFEDYWISVCQFFAVFITYAKIFKDITVYEEVLRRFIDCIGIYYSVTNSTEELPLIYADYLSEFRSRGTKQIFRRKLDGNSMNGELLRIIDYADSDEFIFAPIQQHELGWSIGRSSPLYSGADQIVNLIKGYEFTEAVVDLTKYPLLNEDYISLVGDYLTISAFAGNVGIDSQTTHFINIDPNMDYEISFRVLQSGGSVPLSFGCRSFNLAGDEISLEQASSGSDSSWFFQDDVTLQANVEYWFRGVIRASDTATGGEEGLNIGSGENLKFKATACQIVPMIIVDATSLGGGTVKIKDVKIRPRTIPLTKGITGIRSLIFCWLKNSGIYTDEEVTKIITSKLLPYDTYFKPVYINQL